MANIWELQFVKCACLLMWNLGNFVRIRKFKSKENALEPFWLNFFQKLRDRRALSGGNREIKRETLKT